MEAHALADLNEVQQRAVASLRRDGIVVLRFTELFGEDLWGDALADVNSFVRLPPRKLRTPPRGRS